jgi:DnaJ-class molecular chaperone
MAEQKKCPECKGFGSVCAVDSLGYECEPDCPDCDGTGRVPADYVSWAEQEAQIMAEYRAEQAAAKQASRKANDWPNGEGMPF